MNKNSLLISKKLEKDKIIAFEPNFSSMKWKLSEEISFYELHTFKHTIKESGSNLEQFPYTMNKSKVYLYKLTFLSISLIFLFLAMYIHQSHVDWSCALFLVTPPTLKALLVFSCLTFSLSSLAFVLKIHPIKEILDECMQKFSKKAKKIRKKKIFEINLNTLTPQEVSHKKKQISHKYDDLKDHFEETKNSCFLIVKRILISKTLSDNEKEHLINQAVLEFEQKLQTALNDFRT